MTTQRDSKSDRHRAVQDKFDEASDDGRFEEAMARMVVYHRHCQDPVIFFALGNIRGNALVDLACGDGFYTRRFRKECGADPVLGIDLSPQLVMRAKKIEQSERLGIEYRVADVVGLSLDRQFDVATAIHLLHYLENEEDLVAALSVIYDLLDDGGQFVTMIANPEFDLEKHDAMDSRSKFGYYFSLAEPHNGGLMRFHPGGLEKEREITIEFRRWERQFLDEIARRLGFSPEWYEPFISTEGLDKYGPGYFANYLANPQSKLLRLVKND